MPGSRPSAWRRVCGSAGGSGQGTEPRGDNGPSATVLHRVPSGRGRSPASWTRRAGGGFAKGSAGCDVRTDDPGATFVFKTSPEPFLSPKRSQNRPGNPDFSPFPSSNWPRTFVSKSHANLCTRVWHRSGPDFAHCPWGRRPASLPMENQVQAAGAIISNLAMTKSPSWN